MIDERIIELYRSLLAAANEEKGMLYAQVKALTEEVSMLRLSMEQSKQATNEFLSEIKSLCQRLEEKDKRIADLEEKLSNAQEQNKLVRKKRFVRSSEQAKLLSTGKIIKHVYEVARVQLADGTFHGTSGLETESPMLL